MELSEEFYHFIIFYQFREKTLDILEISRKLRGKVV